MKCPYAHPSDIVIIFSLHLPVFHSHSLLTALTTCLSLSLIRTDSSTAIVKPLHANTWRDSSEDEPPHTFPNPWTVAIGTCCCQFYCPSFFLSFFLISILLLTEVFSFHSLLSHCTALPFLLYCTVCFIDIIYSPVSLSICMPS